MSTHYANDQQTLDDIYYLVLDALDIVITELDVEGGSSWQDEAAPVNRLISRLVDIRDLADQ